MSLLDIKLYGMLDSQSFQKIFPQQYREKFAPHLKILQFQQSLSTSPPKIEKLKFIKQSKNNLSQKQIIIQSNTVLNKYAHISQIIQNNKKQIIRFKSINKLISQNINNSQFKIKLLKNYHPNQIKIISNYKIINQKIINDMLAQSARQINQKLKEKLENLKKNSVICQFTKRIQKEQHHNYRSLHQQFSTKRQNSEKKINNSITKKLPRILIQPSQKSYQTNSMPKNPLQKNKSNQLIDALNVRSRSSSVKDFNSINSTVRGVKSSKKRSKKADQKNHIKIDWISETKRLKDSKHLLKKITFSEQFSGQSRKQMLSNLLGQNQNPSEQKDSL